MRKMWFVIVVMCKNRSKIPIEDVDLGTALSVTRFPALFLIGGIDLPPEIFPFT